MRNRLESAKKAFRLRQLFLTKKRGHSLEEIARRIHHEEHQTERGEYIGDFVYGALDGIVTTFAVISAAAGANLGSGVVMILGFANLFADGISMALGNYLSIKSKKEYEEREKEREEWEIEHLPEAETEEIRQILIKKGFSGEPLERAVNTIISDRKVWVDTMLSEELHIYPQRYSPVSSAMVTFLAFVLIGFFPLLPYVVVFFEQRFFASTLITVLALFVTGSLRSRVIMKVWWRAGLEMLFLGSIASFVAYEVGAYLQGVSAIF